VLSIPFDSSQVLGACSNDIKVLQAMGIFGTSSPFDEVVSKYLKFNYRIFAWVDTLKLMSLYRL